MNSNELFDFSNPGAKFGVHNAHIDNITEFVGNPGSCKLSEEVEVGGAKWYACAAVSSESSENHLVYLLRPVEDGTVWHRWVNADTYLQKPTGTKDCRVSCTNRLVGSPKLHHKYPGTVMTIQHLLDVSNGYLDGDSVTIVIEFSVGADVFSQPQESSDVKFVVQGRYVYAHKGYLAVMSKVFAAMLRKPFEETTKNEIALTDTKLEEFILFLAAIYPTHEPIADDSVMGVYRLAHFYQVGVLVAKCEEHLLRSVKIPVIEKLLLAEQLRRDELCDRVVDRMSVDDIKAVAADDRRKKLSLRLFDLILQKHIAHNT